MPTAKQIKRSIIIKSLPKYIINILLTTGAIAVACSSPYFGVNIVRVLRERGSFHFGKDYETRKHILSTFSRLQKKGYITYKKINGQLYIALTKEGKKNAGKYQINDLEIAQQKQWDGTWRILIFDIPERTRIKREALRGKLKELGFYLLQKSVWVHAYPCHEELELLKNFFGFKDSDYIFLETRRVGGPYSGKLKKHFSIY